MANILTSAAKGGPLTPEEADANLVEINRRTGSGWRDYPCDIVVQPGALNAPVWMEFEEGFYRYAFSPDVRTESSADIHLDHDYKPATMVYPHIHWTLNSNAAGVVRFGITWKYARRADSPTGIIRFTAAQTIYVETTVPANSAGKHMVSEPAEGGGIYHADLDVDGIIMLVIFRDGGHVNDTFIGDVFITKADAHAEKDKAGTPLRTPPFYP